MFEGNIDFYGKSGFTYAREFSIRYHDLPEDADSSFFLCKELIPGYLDDVTGVYQTPQGYYVKDEDVDEFDKGFPSKDIETARKTPADHSRPRVHRQRMLNRIRFL